jgi:hypothetical protein
MTSRCIALLLSLALAGCCGSGVVCGTAAAPGGGVAWDGLGSMPAENAVSADNAPTARARPMAARASSKAQPGDQWEQEQGLDQAADAKLTRQLKICSNC